MNSNTAAETESARVLSEIRAAIFEQRHFILEAGAGSGKTYSLVETLKHLLSNSTSRFGGRQVACITYTNVARDEIKRRVDQDPRVFCSTIHGFAWESMAPFQKVLREILQTSDKWRERQDRRSCEIVAQRVHYSFGFWSISASEVRLGHDDVIRMFGQLLAYEKFRRVLFSKYSHILIDEYQDTNKDLMDAIKEHLIERSVDVPKLGLFGDYWQQIYPGVCGRVEHAHLKVVKKGVNFRSSRSVVSAVNRMRSSLPQVVERQDAIGEALILHTNGVDVARLDRGHWKGDLPPWEAHGALEGTKVFLQRRGWRFGYGGAKVLMLTHRLLAQQQGYASLPDVYDYNDVFRNLDDPYLYYFVEILEPALEAYESKRFGQMYEFLGARRPVITRLEEKRALSQRLDELLSLRHVGTVGEVVDFLGAGEFPSVSADLKSREERLAFAKANGEELGRRLISSQKLREIPYSEIISFKGFHHDATPYATKHGVKGAEFDDVLVVVGRGWNLYNFGDMINRVTGSDLESPDDSAFVRNRNLFYVACTRARNRLAVLFTQELSDKSISHLGHWFGVENLFDVAEEGLTEG